MNLVVLGKWLLVFGLSLAVAGGILWLLGRMGGIQNLPGTLKVESNGFTCVFPLLASILISVILTILLNLVLRGSNR